MSIAYSFRRANRPPANVISGGMGNGRGVFAGLALSALLIVGVACSDDSNSTVETVDAGTAPATTVVETTPVETSPPETAAPETAPPAAAWETVTAPADCMCANGEGFEYYIKRGDPQKVLFYLEGGGACFSLDTCRPGDNQPYKVNIASPDQAGYTEGIWSDDPSNPFLGWSVVFVPYCTGDVHLGSKTMDYGDGVVIQHKGYVNASTALHTMAETFPDATTLVVAGESAGSVPTPLYAGLASDLLPDARIAVLADGSGAYPDVPGINGAVSGVWGAFDARPDWPEAVGDTVDDWSFPDLFIQAWRHNPDIVFSRHDYAFDQVQQFFAGLAGIPADSLVTLIDQNEQQIEAAGVDLSSYITPGDSHTVLSNPRFYSEEVEGVKLVDWVTALVNFENIDDVHCVECNA